MSRLLGPANRTRARGTKWGLLAHIATMFLVLVVNTATILDLYSVCFIDNRDFSGTYEAPDPGPPGYREFIYPDAITVVPNVMFYLNTYLTDGLLVSCVPG